MDRDPAAQLQAGGDSREGTDDGGHLIATRFGGSPGLDNLVAENSFINRSQYKQPENAWAGDLAAGNRVIVNIEPYYGGDTERPTHITGSYTVIRPDGKSFSDSFSLTNDDLRAEEYQMDFDAAVTDNKQSPEHSKKQPASRLFLAARRDDMRVMKKYLEKMF